VSETPFVYKAPLTVARFMRSPAFVRLIKGPFGSGKSSGCVMEMLLRAMAQAPGPDAIRHTRWAVVRNSYRELFDTTKRTIEDWIPSGIRTWHESEATFHVRFNDVALEINLRALDRPDDVKKLLSLELTGAWFNEAKEIPRAVFEGMTGRVGRYPSKRMGGPSWFGIILDTNPPDTDHWIYRLFEEEKPAEYEIFHQPSGLSPEAENVENLPAGYYPRLCHGKTREWIEVFVHGRYGFVRDGKPVYPEYQDALHTLADPPVYLGGKLFLGMDFGLTPAIVVGQKTSFNQWQIIDEFVSESMGATRISEHVAAELKRTYPRAQFRGWGDPAGTQRSQVDERTPYDVVQAAGLPIDPAHTNDFVLRREAVANALTRLTMTGVPRLVVSPKCKILRKAMNGGYCFRRLQVTGSDRFRDAPDKNEYSHIAEALQYLMVGEGEDASALDGPAITDETRQYKYSVKSSKSRFAR
jgi:hypothetical protein